jgi:DNA-binding transcriptional LysR family regulator
MIGTHQMNVFLTAAEMLNFTAAARQLRMTQPSVSQHIHALEQHFRTELFVRKGRKMVLTDAGEALVPLARRMVDWSLRIDETMESLQGEVYGHLKVGCSTTAGKYVLPMLLTAFMRMHPQVTAACQVLSRRQAVEDLGKGLLHFALASPHEYSGPVEFQSYFSDPIRLIVPLNHPWAIRGEIEPHELFEADFILREEGSGTLDVARKGLSNVGIPIDQLRTILTLGNSEAIALAVEEGLGVGFISQIVISRLVNQRVAPVHVKGVNLSQEIALGRNTAIPGTTAQNALWDFASNSESPTIEQMTTGGLQGSLVQA